MLKQVLKLIKHLFIRKKEIKLPFLKYKSLPNYLENRVNSALISPTYTPDSKIYLQNGC